MTFDNRIGADGRGTAAHEDVIAPDAQPPSDTANGTSFRRTPSVGPSAAVAMWKVAASVVTLLGALFYGIGRLLADGFYSNLKTTAGAAGVNTIAIIEPAAIIGALLALSLTAILMLSDILQRWFRWMRKHSGTIGALVATAIGIALIIWAFLYFKLPHHLSSDWELWTVIAVSLVWKPLSGWWREREVTIEIEAKAAKAGAKAGAEAGARAGEETAEEEEEEEEVEEEEEEDKAAGEARAEAKADAQAGGKAGAEAGARAGEERAAEEDAKAAREAEAGAEAGAIAGAEAGARAGAEAAAHLREGISSPWPRVTAVGVISMIIIGLCVGAHYLGVSKANEVKKGIPVDITEFGLDVSSISATRVSLQPVGPSQMIKSLSARNCLLQLGPGASNLLIYDARKHQTFSVPASQVVVVNLTAPKQCVP